MARYKGLLHRLFRDIMQNAFMFHTKDCVGWRDRFLDWMCDLGWLVYDTEQPLDKPFDTDNYFGYKNIILIFWHWNEVGKGWFSSGKKIREMILEDFIETKCENPKK